MKQTFEIKGMSCDHCRRAAERALNSIAGVKATVTLNPPVAVLEFADVPSSIETLQDVLSEAGDYTISEIVK